MEICFVEARQCACSKLHYYKENLNHSRSHIRLREVAGDSVVWLAFEGKKNVGRIV